MFLYLVAAEQSHDAGRPAIDFAAVAAADRSAVAAAKAAAAAAVAAQGAMRNLNARNLAADLPRAPKHGGRYVPVLAASVANDRKLGWDKAASLASTAKYTAATADATRYAAQAARIAGAGRAAAGALSAAAVAAEWAQVAQHYAETRGYAPFTALMTAKAAAAALIGVLTLPATPSGTRDVLWALTAFATAIFALCLFGYLTQRRDHAREIGELRKDLEIRKPKVPAAMLEELGHDVLTRHLIREDAWQADRSILPQEVYRRDMVCTFSSALICLWGRSFGLLIERVSDWLPSGMDNKRVVSFYRVVCSDEDIALDHGITILNCNWFRIHIEGREDGIRYTLFRRACTT